MNNNLIFGGVAAALVLVIGGYFPFAPQQASAPVVPKVENKGSDTKSPEAEVPKTMQIQIALLDTTGEGTGKSRGCDTMNMVTRTAPYAAATLTAALKALFAEPEGSQPDTAYNFIARTKDTLKFDRVTITNGTANIYLTGKLSGLAGVCDDPRAQIQLEETARQFPTVQNVQIYLNGTLNSLTPSQKRE